MSDYQHRVRADRPGKGGNEPSMTLFSSIVTEVWMLGNFPCYTILVNGARGGYMLTVMGPREGVVEGEDSQELQR